MFSYVSDLFSDLPQLKLGAWAFHVVPLLSRIAHVGHERLLWGLWRLGQTGFQLMKIKALVWQSLQIDKAFSRIRPDFSTHTSCARLARLLRGERRIAMDRVEKGALITSISGPSALRSQTFWMGKSCNWKSKFIVRHFKCKAEIEWCSLVALT